jgi:hypothetical protein
MRTVLSVAVFGFAAGASAWIFLTVACRSHSVCDTLFDAAVPIGLVGRLALAVVFVLRRTMTRP